MRTMRLDWIGGFFDADGSITLSRRIRRRDGFERVEFVPALQLSQSDPGILETVAKAIGGKVYKTTRKGESNGEVIPTRDGYTLRADNAQAISASRILIPVTLCKTEELREVVRFYETFNNYTKGWARWDCDEYQRRYELMISEGDACRARLNLLRQNKDTLDVSF